MPKEVKSSFSHFFREDAKLVADVLHEEERHDVSDEIQKVESIIPFIPSSVPMPKDRLKNEWKNIRTFFRQGLPGHYLPPDFVPAILAPAYTKDLVVGDFPIWMADRQSALGGCLSLRQILDDLLTGINGKNKDSILVNNIDRIIHLTQRYLDENGALSVQLVMPEILEQLKGQLQVSGSEVTVFEEELKKLRNGLPDHGTLMSFSEDTHFRLLNGAVTQSSAYARQDLAAEINELKSKLEDLLLVEAGKDPLGQDPVKLKESMGFAANMMKFEALSSLVPDEGSERMSADRLHRIRHIIKDLADAETILDFHASVLIDISLYREKELLWHKVFDKSEINSWSGEDDLSNLGVLFSEKIGSFEKLFAAKKMARLEIENKYVPDIHDDYFTAFTWQNFTDLELQQSTYFILIVDDVHLFGSQFSFISDLLRDNFPIKILAVSQPQKAPASWPAGERPSLHAPVELGALMMSYRNIYVAQSSAINASYLFDQFKQGLTSFAPAFFHVLNLEANSSGESYLRSSAAIEGRDFPGFSFRGLLGTPWGTRFEIDHNPQSTADWPLHRLEIQTVDQERDFVETVFTFGDWAAWNPDYRDHFLPVSSNAWTEDLIPLDLYLRLQTDDRIGKVPFIWMVDGDQQLHRVVVSWPVTVASQERLDFWHFLQENSGINNSHVALAVARALAEEKKSRQAEMDALKSEHELAVVQARREEAGKTMENLVSVLLDLDPSQMLTAPAPRPVPNPDHEPTGKTEISESKDEVDQEVGGETELMAMEPYIDTALCTSCNECINRNKAMFRYNADKMAYIADAHAGTFRQLVEAAEVCPVGIIHPGTPLNPHEPDLDHLIERAAKFN